MAEEIQLTPEQEALYNQSAQPQPINPLRDFDATQLAELAVQDKENFDLVGEFQRNQDLWGDAATVQKTADALDIVKQRGFELSDLPGPTTIGKTILESAKGFGKQLWNYAGAAVGMAQGAITEPFSTELATGFAEGVSEKLAKNIAGTEEAMTGLAQIPEKVVGKARRVLGGPRTPEQKVADLWKDVGRSEVQQQRLTGQGPFTQAVTGGVAGELPAEEVSTLAAGDPFSFATFSKGFQLGGKLIPGVVRTGAAKTGEALGTAAAVTGGRTVQAAGKLTEIGADAVKAVAPTTGGIAGAIKGGALGGPLGVIPGIGVGAAGGRVIARGAKQISTAGAKVAEVGKQVAGATPVTSALAQAGRDVLQSAPGAAGIVGTGLVQDIGLAAVTAETPQETEGAIGIGTALGAAGALGRVGRRVISGQLVAPRGYGVNTVTPSSGNFPNFDALHNQAIRTATPGEQTRLNAIRLFAKGSAPGTDIFFTKDKTALASALEASGLSPEQARLFSEQEGFFATNLRDKSGTPRRVIVSTNVEAAPHEAFHAVQDVLGEAANREIDNVVREAYADQWEQFGQRYANRLVGDLAGRDWRETILDETGAGTADAIEKLSQSIGNEIRNQTGAEPAPGFVQDRVRAEWNRILTEARQRNPDATPGQIWRDILSPEESTQAADRYIARELAAENFDVVFKNLGAALDSKQPLTRRLARTAANLIATFGGEEPLVGRRSEIAQVEPRFAVTEAVTKAGRPSKPVTIEAKKKVPSGRTTIIPTTPGAQQDAAHQARTLSADAPETIQAGGTSSPRELLGQLAEAIAQRSGVKLNYLSAPGEPAAAITSNRAARRDIIEAFRTMPAYARALWEKNFFPERVIQTKGGKYQILGWSPEVFAANAHKLAGWLAEHPKVATPYAVDAATKSFTPDAWQQLYADTQQFVQNQQAGATGAGGELVVPRSVTERGFTAPARTGGETALAQANADIINMLFGFKLPETPRITKGRLPLAIAGEEVSAATLPGRVIEPAQPRAPFSGAEAEAQGISGREIMEVNPFRKLVEESGNAPSMIESVQRLNLENIKEVAAAPEVPEFRGNTLTLTAGFQPVSETASRLVAMTPDEWKATITGYTGKLGGGLTGWAFDLGASAKNVADVTALREAVTQLNEAARSISIADEGGFDRKMDLVGRGQAAREAFEAATGSNLEGTNEGSALPFIRKHIDSDYKPPVPGEIKPVLKMAAQPNGRLDEVHTLAEKYAEQKGIDFVPPTGRSTYNRELGKKLADFYENAEHAPDDPEVKQSYDAFKQETLDQFHAIQDAGYDLEPVISVNSPYRSGSDVARDVKENKHLAFNLSEYAFGQEGQSDIQLMLEPTGESVHGRELNYNDMFRAVHDFFAHAKESLSFGPRGEFNAWREHAALYSDEAQGALASETIGQTAWTQLNPSLLNSRGDLLRPGDKGFVPRKDRPFAEQKNIVVPEDLIAEAKGQFQPAKQRKQLKFPKASSGGFKKAWVLPSGEAVQLGGTWHHEWLADNPEVAKRYKLDVPEFTGSDTESVRESALQAGFARINYGVNNGQLTVEARAKDWRKVKNTVEDIVSTNLDDIDRISVTLFDDAVKEIVDSDSSALFNLDTDQEKLAALPFITKGEVRGQFQPASENETGTLFDLPEPKSFPEAVKPKRGQTDIPSDIVGSPLAKQAETREEAISLFADKLKQEAERQSGNPAYNIGKRWYSEFTPELKREFGDDAPLMAELLAATSPQTNVETNFGYAIDVLNNWKAGKFDKLVAKMNEGYRRLEDGSLEKIYRRDVRDGKVENPPEKPTDATYMAHWIIKHDLIPRGTSGQQVGLHSKNVAKVLTRRWLGETRGPKTKNFVQNLLGTGDEATIDIWADRLLRRVGYEGLVERWRILPENVRGVSDDDFEFGQAAFREAAKQLKMKPSDLQAALWFTEKQRWADNGWSDKLDLGDFRTEIKRTAEYRRGFSEGRGPAEVRQEAKQPTPEYEQIGLEITPRRRRVE